jgi:hypothetical protein
METITVTIIIMSAVRDTVITMAMAMGMDTVVDMVVMRVAGMDTVVDTVVMRVMVMAVDMV